MRFRAVHIACVMVLLSTFGAADAQALARADHGTRARSVCILLQGSASAAASQTARRTAGDASPAPLPGAPVAHTRPVWAMRPPAAHTLEQHAATGSGL